MPNEWNTVNVKPGSGGILREIEVLRKQYSDHRSTLERLALDAPTEHLASRYRELIAELDASMAKIADLEMGGAAVAEGAGWPDESEREPLPPGTSHLPAPRGERRTLLVAFAGLFLLAVLALLAWNWIAGGEPETLDPSPAPASGTIAETPPPRIEEAITPPLAISPPSHDYGTIRRGARAARQFEIANNTDRTLPIQLRRSDCRCLWFEYADTIPPRGTTTLTVTVDASKAPPGPLRETVEVATTSAPEAVETFEVTALVQ
ncbi:MAG TPA: DUF1573 domain-containing protein [Thermoanaerobaculia bacterium]|nr:DUF1573 domain-containing protein [Thermoanaerobaculia bacterium]